MKFIDRSVLPHISGLLSEYIFESNIDPVPFYEEISKGIEIKTPIGIKDLKEDLSQVLMEKIQIKNLGIDLPIWFGDHSSASKIMIVALDPKRDHGSDLITLGSIFALHMEENRTSQRNYWNFIKPLLENNFVYLTDIFKIYYEATDDKNAKFFLSNKDKEFTYPDKKPYLLHKELLEREISIINPNKIITLGEDSKKAIKKIKGISTHELNFTKDDIDYIFLPHISRRVTQSIKTIGNLYKGLGLLREDKMLQGIGNSILQNTSLF